jgi:hypothetical protein
MTAESRWMILFRRLWPTAAVLHIAAVAIALPAFLNIADWYILPVELSVEQLRLARIGLLLSGLISLFAALLSLGLASVVYWRKREEPMALYFAYFVLGHGLLLGGTAEIAFEYYFGSPEPIYALQSIYFSAPLIAFIVLFPTGQAQPRWARWLIPSSLFLAAVAVAARIAGFGMVDGIFQTAGGIVLFVALGAVIRRYRRLATPTERQQMKWGLIGILLAVALMASSWIPLLMEGYPLGAIPTGSDRPWFMSLVGAIWSLGLVMIPSGAAVAILRAKLWDTDIIIRRTVMYSAITALLAAVYFGGVTLLQSVFVGVTGQQSPLAVVISTLAIAALFTPLRNGVQRLVDRRFYRQKYDAERTLEMFSTRMRQNVDLDHMTEDLLEVVQTTMQPESISLWLAE